MITRILLDADGHAYFQHEHGDVNTRFGIIKADSINAAEDGAELLSNRHERFVVNTPTWLDRYKHLTRGPQIMLLKDLGAIAAETGMGPESVVGDAGTGSGAAAVFWARIAKHVHSYDVEPKHVEIGLKNAHSLGVGNATFSVRDVYESIPDERFDVFILDVPEPWRCLSSLSSIRIGGWLVAYLPSINQTAQFVNAVLERADLQHRKTVELIERPWSIKGMRVRPSSDGIGHTGFLVYCRRVR